MSRSGEEDTKRSLYSIIHITWAFHTAAAALQLSALHLTEITTHINRKAVYIYQSPNETLLTQTQWPKPMHNFKSIFKVKPSQVTVKYWRLSVSVDSVTGVCEMIANCGIKCNSLKHLHGKKFFYSYLTIVIIIIIKKIKTSQTSISGF